MIKRNYELWKQVEGFPAYMISNTGLCSNGENHGRAKLIEKEVLEIRKVYSTGCSTYQKLGNKFSVSHTTISSIIHRKIWKHI